MFHIDLNIAKYDKESDLEDMLNRSLVAWEKLYGADPTERSLALRFAGVIERAYEKTGQCVAILIDEYDKPLLQVITDQELQEKFRNALKPFYGVMKSKDGCIKFALLTGVTKFGKVSMSSDLNNLMDISMDDRYIDICGITEKEIHTYFEDDLHELAIIQNKTDEEMSNELKERYDGYHFTDNSTGIYNPFSLLNTFAKMDLGSYWFKTGTPSYLVALLKKSHYNLYEMAHEQTSSAVLNSIDANSLSPIPVIYQSGYLTIKGYDKEFGIYKLGFPNKEVEEGFINYLLPFYTSVNAVDSAFEIQRFV